MAISDHCSMLILGSILILPLCQVEVLTARQGLSQLELYFWKGQLYNFICTVLGRDAQRIFSDVFSWPTRCKLVEFLSLAISSFSVFRLIESFSLWTFHIGSVSTTLKIYYGPDVLDHVWLGYFRFFIEFSLQQSLLLVVHTVCWNARRLWLILTS